MFFWKEFFHSIKMRENQIPHAVPVSDPLARLRRHEGEAHRDDALPHEDLQQRLQQLRRGRRRGRASLAAADRLHAAGAERPHSALLLQHDHGLAGLQGGRPTGFGREI